MADGVIDGGLVVHSSAWSGEGTIYGYMEKIVDAVAAPTRRRVDLYLNSIYGQTGHIINSTLSRESDGYYEFPYLRIHPNTDVFEFMIVLNDWPPSSEVQESKIARWVRPEPM
jgi:hypothetical protein